MIVRFETISINNITTSKSAFGEQSVTETLWFKTRAKVHEVNSAIDIKDKYREYNDVTEFHINYSPNAKSIVAAPGDYSITYENESWRIEDAKSTNDRQHVIMRCYRNDPQTAV